MIQLPSAQTVRLGVVYTLPLPALHEADNSPARLRAGDTLALTLSLENPTPLDLKLWNAGA